MITACELLTTTMSTQGSHNFGQFSLGAYVWQVDYLEGPEIYDKFASAG